jgi:hypothetical protein
MHRFEIEHRSDGGLLATCGEHSDRSERGLARKLVNAGVADGPVEAGRPGRVDYRVPSLHAFAAMALSEGEIGFRMAVYKPHPSATVSPMLEHAVSSCVGRRKNRLEGVGALQPVVGGPETALAGVTERAG